MSAVPTVYCSELSTQAGEPLFASATRTDIYLLLEYNGVWGARAFEESQLPEQVKTSLENVQKSLGNCKLLLIRGQGGRKNITSNGFHFYVCQPTELNPRLYEIQLEDYNDLLEVEVESILAGDERYTEYRRTEPLFLVCTHGRRDACCARFGLPAFLELAKLEGDAAWQSSHIGGHRFAANLLVMPHGLLYGRLRAEDLPAAAAAYRRGDLVLPAYRGRVCYLPEAQAGEYYLRQSTGATSVEAFALAGIHRLGEDLCQVLFIQLGTQTRFQVELKIEKSRERVYESCIRDKTTLPTLYRLQALRTEAPQ